MELEELKSQFPKTGRTSAVTGLIPMSFVNAHLSEIKELVSKENLRRFYRGPRAFRGATTTRRADAHSMVLCRR